MVRNHSEEYEKYQEETLKLMEEINRDLRDSIDICDINGIFTGSGTLLDTIGRFEENVEEPREYFTPEQMKRYVNIRHELVGYDKDLEKCECKKKR